MKVDRSRTLLLVTLGLTPVFVLVGVISIPATAPYRLARRQAFWAHQFEQLPVGSSALQVERALAKSGVALECERPRVAGEFDCAGRDPRAFGFLPEWRVHITARFRGGDLVGIEQQALGLGF